MDVKRATARLVDAFARLAKPEVFDPFHVPGKDRERRSFGIVALCVAILFIGLFYIPFEGRNRLVFSLLAIFAAWWLFQGFRDREYRLNRQKAVNLLKASLLREKEPS